MQSDRLNAFHFTSATGQGNCQALLYAPTDSSGQRSVKPRLIQILHGMAEHIGRYHTLAEELARAGYWVGLYDQAGHGQTAPDTEHLGYFGASGGLEALVADVLSMRHHCIAQIGQAEGQSPIFILLGHSMGSFIARAAMTRPELAPDAVVLSGTAGPNRSIALADWLARRSVHRHGPMHRERMIDKMMARSMQRGLRQPHSAHDWLTRDRQAVAAYEADPLCGFPLTAAGYRDLFALMLQINRPDWASQIAGQVPVLLISGTRDPVGDFGRGPRQVTQVLQARGLPVQLRLYADGRHESFNEVNRAEVINDLLCWLKEVLPA